MIRVAFCLLAAAVTAFGQGPVIFNVTNAAVPLLDSPPSTIHLVPRSIAVITGAGLADTTVSSSPHWATALAGTQVDLAGDACFTQACDLVAQVIYASPSEVVFLVPDDGSVGCGGCAPIGYRIVLVRDGVRIDVPSLIQGGPGRVYLDPFAPGEASLVFQTGYDCLFSYSLVHPGSCGFSNASGPNRGAMGAIVDRTTGQLISTSNPAHQGQPLTLWMTGLRGGLALSPTGEYRQLNPAGLGFGVAQSGVDIASTIGASAAGIIGTFTTRPPSAALEYPGFEGLDRLDITFPACQAQAASVEKRYDAFLPYKSGQTGATGRIYLPLLIRPGDPDCWSSSATTLTLVSNVSLGLAGNIVAFEATVSPSSATGTVTFFDGTTLLGSANVLAGTATLLTTSLSVGRHSITAHYGGDGSHDASTSPQLAELIAGVIVDNFPLNTQIGAEGFWPPLADSESFTLTSQTTITGVNIGTWSNVGDSLTSLDWSIGTQAFDKSAGSGTVGALAISQNIRSHNIFGSQIAIVGFSIPAITLNPGTYYLSIGNGVSSLNSFAWDLNNQPGFDAWAYQGELNACRAPGCSYSFQIVGIPGSFNNQGSGSEIIRLNHRPDSTDQIVNFSTDRTR